MKLKALTLRALMLKKARDFFFERGVMEVDCPIITKYASVDTHIDLIPVTYLGNEVRYLHSSPEYGMKRLLSLGCKDIYQLSHVFRDEDVGVKHNPEFMMAEWYRLNFTFSQMIDETIAFIKLFLGEMPSTFISYREVFFKYAGFDYLKMSEDDLLCYIKKNNIPCYQGVESEGKDALLNLILGSQIEEKLGKGEIVALYHYPASQAALAKTIQKEDEQVAERFEIYFEGIELANGYHELIKSDEQEERFEKANRERLFLKKNELPIDKYFLNALRKGIPDCCGVAVGFDRLMMLAFGAKEICDVIPFNFEEA